jgi:soluble lytic murein transglycosylase-like protein
LLHRSIVPEIRRIAALVGAATLRPWSYGPAAGFGVSLAPQSGGWMLNRGTFLGAVALLAGMAGAPAAAADDHIYLQRQNGVRIYSDVRPTHGAFTKIAVSGRPTATASCAGLTPVSMKERAARYDALIHKVSARHGVSPQLVSAVMRVESCYDRKAVSRSGARGLMQLMPGTARELGVNDSFDPEQNVEGGVRYLKAMIQRFNNNLDHGLAAYNAGPQAVAAHRGIPPYPETMSYVKRIRKLYQPPPQT